MLWCIGGGGVGATGQRREEEADILEAIFANIGG